MSATATDQVEWLLRVFGLAGISVRERELAAAFLNALLGDHVLAAAAIHLAERGRTQGVILEATPTFEVHRATSVLVEAGFHLDDAQMIVANIHPFASNLQ